MLDLILRDEGMTVPTFCEKHGIDRFHVDRLLRGQVKRCPPVNIVLDIQTATGGRIVPEMWAESTLREDLPGEIPAAPPSDGDVTDADADGSGEHPAQPAPPATGTHGPSS